MRPLIAAFLLAGCASALVKEDLKVKFSEDVKLDHDQILACVFVKKAHGLACMSIEEFRTRMDALDLGGDKADGP